MKILYALFAFLLVSCTQKKVSDNVSLEVDSASVSKPRVEVDAHYSFHDSSLKEYQLFLNQLADSDADNVGAATKRFILLFKNRDKTTCDSAFYIYSDFYDRVNTKLNETHYESQGKSDSLVFLFFSDSHYKFSKKLTDYLQKLRRNGFDIGAAEATSYVDKNWLYIEENFSPLLTQQMVKYVEQLNRENKEGFTEDGGMAIKPISFVDRIIWWERFNEENPNFLFRKDLASMNQTYVSVIVTGLDNTPLYYYNDKGGIKINDYFKDAYDYLLKTYPDSKAAKSLTPFYSALTRSDTAAIKGFQLRYR